MSVRVHTCVCVHTHRLLLHIEGSNYRVREEEIHKNINMEDTE